MGIYDQRDDEGRLRAITRSAVYPEDDFRWDCPEFNKAAMEAIVKRHYQTVILAALWDTYAAGGILLADSLARPSVEQSRNNFIKTINGTVHALTRAGHRVIIVAQAPVPRVNPVNCVGRAQLTGRAPSECVISSSDPAEADQRVKKLLQLALENERAQVVSLFEQLCDARECRIFTEQGKFVYMDEAHLSAAGAQLVSISLEGGLRGVEQR
jgi:SGNH domain (fused to AT3 domains)